MFLYTTLYAFGGNKNLKPQTAKTWSLGTDIRPPVVPGLGLNVTYYNVDFTNQLDGTPFFGAAVFSPAYAKFVTKYPTIDQVRAIAGTYPVLDAARTLEEAFTPPPAFIPPTTVVPGRVYTLLDIRINNLGATKQDGLDFGANYNRQTSFGAIFADIGGTYILNRKITAALGLPFVNVLNNPGGSRLSLAGGAGAKVGDFTGRVRVNHTHGYDLAPGIITANVSVGGDLNRVPSFTTTDLFFQYDLKGLGFANETALTFNVNNVFNKAPLINGGTIGRFFQLGVRTKF